MFGEAEGSLHVKVDETTYHKQATLRCLESAAGFRGRFVRSVFPLGTSILGLNQGVESLLRSTSDF